MAFPLPEVARTESAGDCACQPCRDGAYRACSALTRCCGKCVEAQAQPYIPEHAAPESPAVPAEIAAEQSPAQVQAAEAVQPVPEAHPASDGPEPVETDSAGREMTVAERFDWTIELDRNHERR
jgi:hypothetical protein